MGKFYAVPLLSAGIHLRRQVSAEQLAAVAAALQACGFTGLRLRQLLARAPAVLGRRPEDIYAVRRCVRACCLSAAHDSISWAFLLTAQNTSRAAQNLPNHTC